MIAGQAKQIFGWSIILLSLFIATRSGSPQRYPNENGLLRSSSTKSRSRFRRPTDGPALAWLMTFPNSGTSYTLALVGTASATHYGTNYGQEQQELIPGSKPMPLFPKTLPHGPFWRYNLTDVRHFPKELVLTKTHCGGRCLGCRPSKYIEASYSFRRRCAEAQERTILDDPNPATIRMSYYSESLVERVVHILRDPYDNVVARFHHEAVEGRIDSEKFQSNAREGFRDYCLTVVNPRHAKAEVENMSLEPAVLESVKDIPCYSDFFRYAEWHNQAFWAIHDMGVDWYTLYYEDYQTRHDEVLNELLHFLRLPRVADPEKFYAGHTYRDYYTDEERSRLKAVLQRLSSQTTWEHLQRYIRDIPDPTNMTFIPQPRRMR